MESHSELFPPSLPSLTSARRTPLSQHPVVSAVSLQGRDSRREIVVIMVLLVVIMVLLVVIMVCSGRFAVWVDAAPG